MHCPRRLSLLVAAALATGCQATVHRFQFDPSPAEFKIQPDPEGPVRARGLVTVIEGRRMEEQGGQPALRLRLRLDNNSSEPLTLEIEKLELVGSELEIFGPPRLDPAGNVDLLPGESRTLELYFPYPPGVALRAPNLTGLNLNIGLAWPGQRVDVGVPFTRTWTEYAYYPYPYYYGWHWGVGFYYG